MTYQKKFKLNSLNVSNTNTLHYLKFFSHIEESLS